MKCTIENGIYSFEPQTNREEAVLAYLAVVGASRPTTEASVPAKSSHPQGLDRKMAS